MRSLVLIALTLYAAATLAAPVSFSKQISPILADQCVECHRAGKSKGAYRLDAFSQLMIAGDSGDAPVTPGKPEASLLLSLITTPDEDDRMPKKADALPPPQQSLIRQWIAEGAKFDGPDAKAPLASLLPQEKPQSPEKYPHPIPVTAMALNGDGKVLITSGYHEVLAWDPETGKLRARLPQMPERVLALSFVAGGPWLIAAGGSPGRSGEVWLVNYAKPAERKRLVQMRDCALCAVTSADGKFAITGGADNHLRGFSLPDGKPLWDTEAHADWVLSLAISADGKYVATGSRDRTARIMHTESGEIEATVTGLEVPVQSVAFAPGREELLTGGSDGQVLWWYFSGSARKDGNFKTPGKSEVVALSFLDNETPVAATGNGQVNAFDMKSHKPKLALTSHPDRVDSLLISGSGDARRIITGGHEGEVHLVQAKDGKTLLNFTASPGF